MGEYSIQYFNLDTGVPSATLAEYGITLNSSASRMLAGWKYARAGVDRSRRVIVLQPHNDDAGASGSLRIAPRRGTLQYFRISNRDFVRVAARYCGVTLVPSFRCLVEWDQDEELLIVDPKVVLATRRSDPSEKEGKTGV